MSKHSLYSGKQCWCVCHVLVFAHKLVDKINCYWSLMLLGQLCLKGSFASVLDVWLVMVSL